MRVVVAPDSFKGSISAAGAAAAIASGWRRVRPLDEVRELPLADGGEGTLAVLAAAVPGARWHHAGVSGPGEEQIEAAWLEMPGNVAVVELATAAGLPQLPELRPLTAHTYGVGELIAGALDSGAAQVVIALGGSASTDGGTGALAALGARFLDDSGAELPRGGGPLARLAAADLTGLRAAAGRRRQLPDRRPRSAARPGGRRCCLRPAERREPGRCDRPGVRPGPAGRAARR